MFNLKLGNDSKKAISILNNPFTKNGVESVIFVINKNVIPSAVIEFRNNLTTGKQIIESDSFSSLVMKVEEFIKSLDK